MVENSPRLLSTIYETKGPKNVTANLDVKYTKHTIVTKPAKEEINEPHYYSTGYILYRTLSSAQLYRFLVEVCTRMCTLQNPNQNNISFFLHSGDSLKVHINNNEPRSFTGVDIVTLIMDRNVFWESCLRGVF